MTQRSRFIRSVDASSLKHISQHPSWRCRLFVFFQITVMPSFLIYLCHCHTNMCSKSIKLFLCFFIVTYDLFYFLMFCIHDSMMMKPSWLALQFFFCSEIKLLVLLCIEILLVKVHKLQTT